MKRLLTPLLLALCASLLGCASSGPFKNKMEPEPVMAGLDARVDVSEHVKLPLEQNCSQLGAALQGNVKISESGRLAVYAHCAALCDAQIAVKDAAGITNVCGGQSANPWLAKVAHQSFKQIRRSCDAWFNVLEKQRVEIQYNQTNANVASGAIATVLAAAGGHTRAVFNLAAATTMGNAMVENYKASFLFTPELAKLHDKVSVDLFDAREQAILGKLGNNGYASWGQLVSDIAEFEELCSHKRIVEIMNKAMDIAKFSFAPVGISVEAQNTANELKKALGVEKDAELMGLAALAEFPMAQRAKAIQYLESKDGEKTQALIHDGKEKGPLATLVSNVKTLKLDTSDEHVRNLQRLADVLKWDSSDAFNQRKTLVELWALKAPMKELAVETGVTPPAPVANAALLLRNNRPQRNNIARPAAPPLAESTQNNSTAPRNTFIDREMSKVFGKSPSAPVQGGLSRQIIATPK